MNKTFSKAIEAVTLKPYPMQHRP